MYLFRRCPLVLREVGVEDAGLGCTLEAESTVVLLAVGETGQSLPTCAFSICLQKRWLNVRAEHLDAPQQLKCARTQDGHEQASRTKCTH